MNDNEHVLHQQTILRNGVPVDVELSIVMDYVFDVCGFVSSNCSCVGCCDNCRSFISFSRCVEAMSLFRTFSVHYLIHPALEARDSEHTVGGTDFHLTFPQCQLPTLNEIIATRYPRLPSVQHMM